VRSIGTPRRHERSVNRLFAMALLSAMGCGKSKAPSGTEPESETEPEVVMAPMDAREASQWAAAAQGEPEELMRLEDLVGCDALRGRASQRDLRATAIRAMQYCRDFSELPWLVEIATEESEADARAALEAIDELAARPRRATDPEDALELHEGCGALLTLARATARPKELRVLAIRALRMLSERGCVKRTDIPTDVDVK
jgi:hypothetical protein